MHQTIIFGSLALILVLFLVQSIRIHKSKQQASELLKNLKDLDKQASLGRLLVGIAHDLNTPLGAMACAMQTRKSAIGKLIRALETQGGSLADDPGLQKAVVALESTEAVLDESLTRTREMLDDLRKAGRDEPEDLVIVPVLEVLNRVLRLLDHEFKAGITVVKEVDPGLLVRVRPGALGRVFGNLLVNAKEAMDGKGEIQIVGRLDSGKVFVKVTDSGPGFPAGDREKLFGSGWSTKCSHAGSGLGLFISREIIQGFGGEITAANGPAGGAEMTVWIPVASESATGVNQ